MIATITFDDGTTITAEKNSDCYITDEKPEFPEDIAGVLIESEDGDREYENAILLECASIDERYWFAFVEKSPEQLEKEELQENISMLEDALVELAELIG